MKHFKSAWSYSHFANAVNKTRFIFDEETREFLDCVVATSESRLVDLEPQSILFRAQVGCDWALQNPEDEDSPEIPIGFGEERMKPRAGIAREGRANPAGISYLYLAEDTYTAIAEMRPWIGAQITVAQFEVVRHLRLVDCSQMNRRIIVFGGEPSPERRTEAVWRSIDSAFARPIVPSDTSAEYVPTQILTELFKTAGYDGIMHRSSVGGKRNFIFYNLSDAKFLRSRAFTPTKITFEYDPE